MVEPNCICSLFSDCLSICVVLFFQSVVWSGAEFIWPSICLTKARANVPVSLFSSAYPLSHLSLSILLHQSCERFFFCISFSYRCCFYACVAFISNFYNTYLPHISSYCFCIFMHHDSELHISNFGFVYIHYIVNFNRKKKSSTYLASTSAINILVLP